jgi:hypothetical protein
MKRQIVKKDSTPRFQFCCDGKAFVHCIRPQSIPEAVSVTGITIVDNSGFVGTRK